MTATKEMVETAREAFVSRLYRMNDDDIRKLYLAMFPLDPEVATLRAALIIWNSQAEVWMDESTHPAWMQEAFDYAQCALNPAVLCPDCQGSGTVQIDDRNVLPCACTTSDGGSAT